MPTLDAQRATRELLRRERDGVKMFRALPYQDPFFRSVASEVTARGANRSGKTSSAAVRFAAIARDKSVVLSDGTELEMRRPWQKDRPLIMWIIGLKWTHIGNTIYRVLFKPGLYKIIRDEKTKEWRAYHPTKDAHRESETKPSFPLIPMSEVKGGFEGIAWEDKKKREFSSLELVNGTMIHAFASTGEVEQGVPVDEVWIDEEIDQVGHYPEWQMRTPDTKGRITWSSVSRPNPALMEVARRAEEQKREVEKGERDKPDVEDFVLKFLDNPFIDDEEKQKKVESLSEDEAKMRIEGEFTIGNLKIYPSFDRGIHCAIYEDESQDDGVSRILRENGGVPPSNWTRDLILDPGSAKPGVLFGAIPPRSIERDGKMVDLWGGEEPYYIVYDEIYIPRLTAGQIANRIARKSKGFVFQRFIIDGQAARQTPMGFAGTVGGNYTKEFRKYGLKCVETASTFVPGDPNFQTRSQLVDEALLMRSCGTPQLRVVINRCPQFVYQMENNLKAVQKGPDGQTIVLDKPANGQKDDLRVGVEYWLSRYPTYIEPPKIQRDLGGPGLAAYKEIQKTFGNKSQPGVIRIGPGAAA